MLFEQATEGSSGAAANLGFNVNFTAGDKDTHQIYMAYYNMTIHQCIVPVLVHVKMLSPLIKVNGSADIQVVLNCLANHVLLFQKCCIVCTLLSGG